MKKKKAVEIVGIFLAVLMCTTGCTAGKGVLNSSAEVSPNASADQGAAEESATGKMTAEETAAPELEGTETDIDPSEYEIAAQAVENMKLGWNVGNALDCYGTWIAGDNPMSYEIAWGNPIITRNLIHCVKESGFHAIRLPVTWFQHMDENGKVSEEWLARVKTVVDYVLDEGMYCVINVHHDTGGSEEAWLRADSEMYDSGMSGKYACLWEQIAEYFKDYGEKLLFESFNEILDKNAGWGGSGQESYDVVNKLNQLFVDVVRGTGGNNEYRNIIVLTYGASSADSQVKGFLLPMDTVENHMIAEVHIYDPSGFCGGEDETWDAEDEEVLGKIFERLNEKIIIAQKVPMIVGEFGSQDRFHTEEYMEERAEYASCFVSIAKAYGITCFWWDDGGSMKLFDRISGEPAARPVIDAMVSASGERR